MPRKRWPLICISLFVFSIVFMLLLAVVACQSVFPAVVGSEVCKAVYAVMLVFVAFRIVGNTSGWIDTLPHLYSVAFAVVLLGIIGLIMATSRLQNPGIVIAAVMVPALPEIARLVLAETALKNGWKWPDDPRCDLF